MQILIKECIISNNFQFSINPSGEVSIMQLYSKNYASDHDEKIQKEFDGMLEDARSAGVLVFSAPDVKIERFG